MRHESGKVSRTLMEHRAYKMRTLGALSEFELGIEGVRTIWLQSRGWEGARPGVQRPWP